MSEATCWTCKGTLTRLQEVQGERFCGERCRWKYATIPRHLLCAACGKPLPPRDVGAGHCAAESCRREMDERAREVERRRIEGLRQEAERLRAHAAGPSGIQLPEIYEIVIIPSAHSPIADLPEARRRAFRDRLAHLIRAASADEAGSTPTTLEPSATIPALEGRNLLGRACSLCRGHCCTAGGDRAYLTERTIRRYMALHPDQPPGDVLAAYVEKVGLRTVEGSCVYHGPDGCTLPREMRSDTCNNYFCPGLDELRRRLDGVEGPPAPQRAFLAATRQTSIVAAAFCDQDSSITCPSTVADPEPVRSGDASR